MRHAPLRRRTQLRRTLQAPYFDFLRLRSATKYRVTRIDTFGHVSKTEPSLPALHIKQERDNGEYDSEFAMQYRFATGRDRSTLKVRFQNV